MSSEYVFLSFFKTNKIDYLYHSNTKTIEFPCIHCHHSAKMNTNTSEWFCDTCHQKGNIIRLIEFNKQHSFGKLFNPKKELKRIIRTLNKLSKKYPNETKIISIQNEVIYLVNYCYNSNSKN